ncbi:MAG: hypothetical protein JSS99_08845 [Actinobacteria bacterium]|nr:hypothetical protein [Actinomycetota bacterium]
MSAPEQGVRRRAAALGAADAAWLAVVPTVAIMLAAIVLLGPWVGTLRPTGNARFLSGVQAGVHPEPTEQGRYLVALLAPLLLAALTLLLVRRPPSWAAERSRRLARAAEALAVAVLAGCFVAQRLQLPQGGPTERRIVYFTMPSVLFAVAVAAALAVAARSTTVREAWAAWSAPSRSRLVLAFLLALGATAVTLLPAISADGSLAHEYEAVIYHMQFTYDESVSVLAGRSPLGDFATQYAALWPYAIAAVMSLLGTSVAVFTGVLATITGLALLALYDVLRRVARSPLTALLLYVPLLATSALKLHGPWHGRFSLVTYYGVMPLRYAGPFFLAWLLVRHLDGVRGRRDPHIWPLFLVGGMVALNNTDFGIAAVGATIAALLWTSRRPNGPRARRLALEAAGGMATAFALVTLLLVWRTGGPPHFELLLRYARIFVVEGFANLPMKPVIGFHLVVYLTYVAAIGVATVRAIRRDPDRLMTGMLVWSGVFGLGAGSYYVGHSLSEVLMYTFPVWALTVVLLTLLSMRALAASTRRWPAPAMLACLFAFGLLVCSLAQTPSPWDEVRRIGSEGPKVFARPIGEAFVAQYAQPGEAVLVMSGLGQKIALNLGLDDVERFTGARSMFTLEQLEESVAALRAARGTKIFVLTIEAFGGLTEALERAYELRAQEPQGMTYWVQR